jgi:choline transport protein
MGKPVLMAGWIIRKCCSHGFQITFLANLFHPSYEVKPYQTFLIMECILLLNGLLNAVGTRMLPKIDTAQFWWFLGSFLIVAITAVASANPHQPAKFVFATFVNETGWTNPFVVFMNGLVVTAGNFVALDSISHISEEMSNPSRTIPRAMIMTVIIGGVTDFIVCICLLFSVGQDQDAFFESGAPYLTIMLTSTRSKVAAAYISTMQLVNNFNSTTSVIQVGSRIIWSFARDGGFIFPKFFSKVNPKLVCPLPAVIMSWAIGAIISVLYLASTTAFNALLSCLVILAYFAYAIPIICLLCRGQKYDRQGTFQLGKSGWFIKIGALAFMSFLAIFFCFPVYRPVTKTNMSKSIHDKSGLP